MKLGKWAVFSSLFVILIFSNCAGTYRAFKMETIPFKESVSTDTKIAYSTRQGVMYNTRNFKAAKREQKGQYSILAVKIINKTELPIALGDLAYSCGGSTSVKPVVLDEYLKQVKQKAG